MKKLFLAILAIALMTSTVWGASLVCDPQAGVTKYRIDGTIVIDAEADGSMRYNTEKEIKKQLV